MERGSQVISRLGRRLTNKSISSDIVSEGRVGGRGSVDSTIQGVQINFSGPFKDWVGGTAKSKFKGSNDNLRGLKF